MEDLDVCLGFATKDGVEMELQNLWGGSILLKNK